MIDLKKDAVLFAIGGIGYAAIEIIWRGHTHPTMICAGGICFILFSRIASRYKNKSIFFKAALCAVCVTAVELAFGLIFNVILKMNVWDYSKLPMNFLGQICPLFTLMWGALGIVFIPIADLFNEKIFSRHGLKP